MCTVITTKRRGTVESERKLDVRFDHSILDILEQVGKKLVGDHYFLTVIPADYGKGFQLEKFKTEGGEIYHVNLNGRESTCECHGFLRWARCKHLVALGQLVKDGVL